MEILLILFLVLLFIWVGFSTIMFLGKWSDWSMARSLKKTYQRHVDNGDSWYKSYVIEQDDAMIEASREMIASFTWPLRIFGGLEGMLSYGSKKTSVEIQQEEKFRKELEASIAKEKAMQMAIWEKEFHGG